MQMVNILKENCDPSKDNNEQLPYNAYLIQYKVGDKEELKWDLVMGHKQSEIFDHYYDKYKKDFVTMKQAEGQIRPNLWNDRRKEAEPPKKKRKRKTDA